jgi:YggT family protein
MGTLIWLIDTAVDLYVLLIIVRAVLSWVNPSPYHPAVRFVIQVTEPVLMRIRRIIPPIAGLDLSPLIAIVALVVVKDLVIGAMYNLVRGPRW